MFKHIIVATLVFAYAALAPAASFADSRADSRCSLQRHHVTAIKPYDVQSSVGLGHVSSKKRLGAELLVQAEPGLTAEWLRLELSREIAHMQQVPMKGCPLEGVRIQVDSAGAGFSVKLIARDPGRASEVLQHARALVQ
jgi:hypothetical protein